MKVLQVVPYASLLYGGPPIVVARMAEVLSGLGVDVDVVTTAADGLAELNVPTDRPVMQKGIPYFYFPRRWPRFWMFSWGLTRWLWRNVRKYDVVHVHNLFAYTTLPACAAAHYFAKPYVITPHGMLDPWCLSHKWWKKLPYYHLIEKRNLLYSSAVHVTSSFELDGMSSLGFGGTTHVIPLYVESPVLPARSRHENDALAVLFLSRLDPIKGLPTLLRALALLRGRADRKVELTIAGAGSEEYIADLQAMAKSLNITENVNFVGFLKGEARLQALADADVFVLTSYHENFSLATAEAMAAGLPVIVSDQVGIAREISSANAGIVVPVNSVPALADAIETFFSERVRKMTGENGRNLVKQSFSKEQFGKRLLDLYKKIVSSQTSPNS